MATDLRSGSPDGDRRRRLRRVVLDVARRRAAGEPLPDEAVIAANGELMPELAERLAALSRVETARDAASPRAGRADLDPASADGPVQFTLPGYEIIHEIRRGGQGVVYKAVQLATGKDVAIKIVRRLPFDDRHDKARFDREVNLLARLRHPNIVTVLDSGSTAACRFFVMDYIEGRSLDDFVAVRAGAVRETLALFLRVCKAVHSAHLHGVIHRDLKPGNIRIDADGEPHILDFGLAKPTGDGFGDATMFGDLTVTGQFVGSMPWASPEQVDGRSGEIDLRTDVYALGVILYHLLTGQFPYPIVGSAREVLTHILHTEPARPRNLRADIDDDVQAIALKCLAKDPERRYQSVGALADDMERCLSGLPVVARAPSAAYQLKKLVVRNKLVSALLSALCVLLLTFAVAMSVLYTSAATERNRAQRAEHDAAREAEAARAVNDFLVSEMLGAASPDISRGRDLRVAEVLENASARIGPALADEPLVEAAVRTTIGATYRRLGMFTEAIDHLRRAEQIRLDKLGPQASDSIETRLELVAALRDGGLLQKSDGLSLSLLNQTTALLGPDDPLTLGVAHERGTVLFRLGWVAESADMHWDTLSRRRRILGETHDDTLASLNAWGWAGLRESGRSVEAEEAFRSACDHARAHLGDDHPTTLSAKVNLASALCAQRRFTEAERLLVTACEDTRRVLGAAHPATGAALRWLAMLRKEQDRVDEAEAILRELIQLSTDHLGERHPSTTESMEWLGPILLRAGQPAEAAEVIRAVTEARANVTGPESAGSAHRLDQLGTAYANLGRYEQAEQLHRTALEVHLAAGAPDDLNAMWSMRELVVALAGRGKAEEARPITLRLLELRRRIAEKPGASAYQLNCCARELLEAYPPDMADPARALEWALRAYGLSDDGYHYNRFTLARAYEANGDIANATEMARIALQHAPIECSMERADYESLLVRLYESVGDGDAAERVYRDTLAARRVHFPEGHPDIAASLFDLGTLLTTHGKLVEAEDPLHEALDLREALLADTASDPFRLTLACNTAHTLLALGQCLVGQERHDDAEPLLMNAYERLAGDDHCHVDLRRAAIAELAAHFHHENQPEMAAHYRSMLADGAEE
jgi:tetratricopeptide (TPR) repeat protein/tRNA A-37 threonylcarbamoyl transferase component Bud32